ncbi:MAG: choloylglycine hydrolase family protein [Bacteroidetes bacterium]|nr:choloylglycine hydrolase family protein [Bacteroidota bacterium]
MKTMKRKLYFFMAICCLTFLSETQACTIFRMKAKDGTITLARSMEFGANLNYDLIVVPRNKPFFSPSPVSKLGLKWTTLNGYVGVASMGLDFGVSDGMNEKGLSVSVLWYESDMQYQTVAPADSGKALAQVMFADWALANFSTVDEVKSAISKVKVFFYSDPTKMKMPVTVHFIVYDANGGCIVVEYDKGQCNIYDNPLGVMTNAPSLPWQYTNLRQYIGLENVNPIPVKVGGFTFSPTGHGDGMFGIPGDYTPPSRFVRLAMFENFVTRQPDAASNLNLCQHIINTFSIPFGIIVDKDASGNIVSNESTQWVTFRDLTNRQFYFKTYENPTLRMIDLKNLDFSAKEVRRIPMYGSLQTIIDITNQKKI